jgi:uncharacterized protein YndB with AHSA1/START domain
MAAGRTGSEILALAWLGTKSGPRHPRNVATIKHNFVIGASVDKVYAAVTTVEGLGGWWTTGATGNPNKGGKLRFEFDHGLYNIMQVADLRRNRFVAWKCRESVFASGKEWIGTRITFKLSRGKDGSTGVKFEHSGWRKASDFYGLCNFHWAGFMVSLKSLCETGKGEPYVV